VTSDFWQEVEIRPFCACAMKNMQFGPYLWPNRQNLHSSAMDLWTRLWGRHHVPQNVFLVTIVVVVFCSTSVGYSLSYLSNNRFIYRIIVYKCRSNASTGWRAVFSVIAWSCCPQGHLSVRLGSEFQTICPARENARRQGVLCWWRGTFSWRPL